jgi:hypothetical protein
MKINEVMVEGFWSGLGAIGKGLAKGVAQGVAPNTMANDKTKREPLGLGHIPSAEEVEINNALTTILAKAKKTGSISMDDIVDMLKNPNKLSETLTQYIKNPKELAAIADYIASELTAQGIKVTPARVSAPKKAATGEVLEWDPTKSLLTIADKQYQMKGKGWKNWYTKAMVTDPDELEKIQSAFMIATGQAKAPAPVKYKPIQVKSTLTGAVLTKNEEDGNWYHEDGAEETNLENIKELERRAKPQYQNRQMQGQRIPPAPGTIPQD